MRDRGDVHRCSFCGASHKDVAKLIAGPDVNICDACVDSFYEKFVTEIEPVENSASLRADCSFCAKRREKVKTLAGDNQYAICDECLSICAEIVDEDAIRNNRPSRNRRAVSPEDVWSSIEHIAKNRINSEAVFYIYVRLAVASSMQEDFVNTWRRRLSAALIFDGAKAVSYVFGGTSGSKARWAVMAHHTARCHELGDATKCVVDKMHEAGILLRKATWFFVDGARHSV